MGKTVFIVILVVLAVCALKSGFQRAAVSPPAGLRPAPVAGPVSTDTRAEILDAAATEKTVLEPASAGGDPAGQVAQQPTPDVETAIGASDAASGASAPGDPMQRLQADAEFSPVQATILKEEENGQVTFPAAGTADYTVRLNDIVQNHQYTASWDLLTLFRGEFDSDNKEAILSMTSLLPRDQNTRLLLQTALSYPEPAGIRAQAAAFAADDPEPHLELLLSHANDPDPLVRLTIENVFLDIQPTTRVVGARTEPAPVAWTPSRPN